MQKIIEKHCCKAACSFKVKITSMIISSISHDISSDFRIEAQLTRLVILKLTKPYLIKLPQYEAFPPPTFLWEYTEKSTGSYVNIIGDQSLYVTNVGDLLLTSVEKRHLTTYKVVIKHQAIPEKAVAYLYTVRGRCKTLSFTFFRRPLSTCNSLFIFFS